MAVGRRAQAGALREAGPGRLRRGPSPRVFPARHTVDFWWHGTVDIRALLADEIYRVSAAAARAAPTAHPRRTQTRVSGALPAVVDIIDDVVVVVAQATTANG